MEKDKAQLVTAMSIFGTIGLVRRFIPYSSGLVAFVRAFIGVLFLLGFRFLKKESLPVKEVKDNLLLLCLSGVALGVNWILLFEAYRFTSISVATICYYMAPVIVIVLSPLLFNEKITLQKGICAFVAVLGMFFVSGVFETGFSGLTGVFFGLGAAVMYATVIVLNKKIEGLSSNDRTVIQLGISAISLFPYILLTEDFAHLEFEFFAILMLLVAGVIHTGIAYALYFGSIRTVPAQTVALFSYIDPIIAVILSAFVLKEGLSLMAAIGVVMVIAAAIASEFDLSKKGKLKPQA